MKKVLFISSNNSLLDFAHLFLNKGVANITFDEATSLSKAISYLKENDDYEMIFLGHQIQKDASLGDLSKLLINLINEKKTQLVGTNKAFKEKDWARYFHELTSPNRLLMYMNEALNSDAISSEYVQIPLLTLLRFETYPFDCFVRLTKNGQERFIKIFNINDEVQLSEIEKYRDKKLEALSVPIAHINEVIQKYENQTNIEASFENVDELKESVLEYSMDLLKEVGVNITKQHMKLTQQAFQNTEEIINTSVSQKQQLKDMVNKNQLFYYKHITLTSLISCFILDEIKLTDVNLKGKLCLASNLQNICLDEDDELKTFSEDQVARFDKKIQEKVLNHAFHASTLLEKNDKIESDVIKIIKEHHGSPSGKGLIRKISSTSKLSLIFQLSSQFAQKFLISQEQTNDNVDVLKIFNEIYSRLESKDLSLVKSLKEVAIRIS